MKTPYIATLGFLAASLWMSTAAHANEVTGVTCPSGFTATTSNGDKKLTCSVNKTYTRQSICSPIVFNGILPTAKLNVVMQPSGSDKCLAVVSGKTTSSVMEPPLPGMPEAKTFRRVVSGSGPDRFEATVTEYAFPQGATLPYIGDAAKGVSCPSGYDGDKRSDGRGIRCDKIDRNNVAADCDFGWTLRVDDLGRNEDKCIGINGPGPTKPRGMTKVQFDIENALPQVKWHLAKNNGSDKWKKKLYAFPRAN